ncbi:MAG TPA: small multi-drug export protein [Candidatus Magasanikbacteria bacterium]|mgnify:CR=1 FL=1|jgi:uncharacterized membrane protein|nr:small multi-drug export protein [Candidatus Magasanikbacteria bacterium]HQF57114.1 small multi-drug export protein [Candidatus Magasanikbacteria bacterium]HQL52892.1 small multi-drug export protein [Candidatus Magasanikbacteria bacterium]
MFDLNPIQWFTDLSPEWATFFISMIPLTELRASIPIALEVYKMSVWQTWLIAVAGNMLPIFFILYLFPIFHDWLIKKKFIGSFLRKKMELAEKKFSGQYAKYGAIALIIFIGIPLPLTGAWTGALVAFIFNIPFRKSAPLILAGVCLAATIVTFITLFAGGTIRWLI